MLGEQFVADIMKIADDRRGHAHLADAVADMGHGRRGFVAIHRNTDKLGAGPSQSRDLARGRFDIRRIGIGHRLDDDRRAAADRNRVRAFADPNADAVMARSGTCFHHVRRQSHVFAKLVALSCGGMRAASIAGQGRRAPNSPCAAALKQT